MLICDKITAMRVGAYGCDFLGVVCNDRRCHCEAADVLGRGKGAPSCFVGRRRPGRCAS